MEDCQTSADINGNVKPSTEKENEVGSRNRMNEKTYRYIRTVLIFAVYSFAFMVSKLLGTTMIDLVEGLQSNYEDISQAISLLHPGRVVGSLMTGYLLGRFPNYDDMGLSVMSLVYGGSTFMIPWVRNVDLFGALYFVQGTALGGVMSMGNFILLNTWTTRASTVVNAAYATSAFTMVLVPFIASPFLGTIHNTSNNGTNTVFTNNSTEYRKPSRIEIPYSIIAGTLLFPSIGCALLQTKKPGKKTLNPLGSRGDSTSLKNLLHPGSCAEGNCVYGSFMCCCLILYLFSCKCADETILTYMLTYAVESNLKLTKQDAAWLDAMQSLALSIGRVFMSIATFRIPVQYLLLPFLLGTTIFAACFCYVGVNSTYHLWGVMISTAFLYGPVYLGGLAFANHYIEVTSVLISLADVFVAMGGLTTQLIVGYLLQNHSAQHTIYFLFVSMAFATFVALLLYSAGCWRGSRDNRTGNRNCESLTVTSEETECSTKQFP